MYRAYRAGLRLRPRQNRHTCSGLLTCSAHTGFRAVTTPWCKG